MNIRHASKSPFDNAAPKSGREWLVIEDSAKNMVFASEEQRTRKGYIPRDVAEPLLGRKFSKTEWFTREESDLMRAHPEWRDTLP